MASGGYMQSARRRNRGQSGISKPRALDRITTVEAFKPKQLRGSARMKDSASAPLDERTSAY